jgi:hypothetical protein
VTVSQQSAGHVVTPDHVPDWQAVEELIADLAAEHTSFATVLESSNRITGYEPGRRFRVETPTGSSSWIQVEYVKTCWENFERLGRICRRDVLEPGRSSALMMALFERLPGVDEEDGDEQFLVLARRRS